MHVFVSGAGPVGLSAAIALIGRGHRVTIIDRDASITDESRAVVVNRNSLELLAPSGVAQKILDHGERVRALRVLEEGSLLTRVKLPGQDRRWPTGVALAQSNTEAHMVTRLKELGGAVEWNHELHALTQDDGGVRVTVLDRQTGATREIAADYALGADGSHSATRKALGIPFEGRAMPEEWSLADVWCDWPWPEQACVNFSRHHDLTFMITIANGRYRLIGNHPDVLGAARKLMNVKEVVWANPFHVHLSVAQTLVKGRVCLAGDAAHTHSPVGGRGMNLGIADAFAFADAVDTGDFETYRKERHVAARRTVDLTDGVYRFATATSRPRQILRDMVLRTVGVATRTFA